MKKIVTQVPEIKLVGITARTSNAREMNPETAQIGSVFQTFSSKCLQEKIQNRKNPGTLFSVYTDYESNEHGEYTYFLGEEVTYFDSNLQGLEILTIPAQSYVKFTSDSGKMPAVCIEMWQNIWKMKASDLGGERAYIADFEVYDQRSKNPEDTILDIYIGIRK